MFATDHERLGVIKTRMAYGRWICDGCGKAMWAHNAMYAVPGHSGEWFCYRCMLAKRNGQRTLKEMGVC